MQHTEITKIRRVQKGKTHVPNPWKKKGWSLLLMQACFILSGQGMFYFQKAFKRTDQMDIFSKLHMWRIKGDHGALKMFLTDSISDTMILFSSFSCLSLPSPCCSNPIFIWILLLHIFLPYTNLELLISLLPLFSLFNLPTGSHALLLKLSVLFSI